MTILENFVALKKWNFDNTGLDLSLDDASFIEASYENIRENEDIEKCEFAPLLTDLGLEYVEIDTKDSIETTLPSAQKEQIFSRLPYAGAYLINAKDKSQAKKVREVLSKGYEFVRDVAFQSLGFSSIQNMKEGSNFPEWREETGIKSAHKEGLTGESIKVLMLDSGVYAEHSQFKGLCCKKSSFHHF